MAFICEWWNSKQTWYIVLSLLTGLSKMLFHFLVWLRYMFLWITFHYSCYLVIFLCLPPIEKFIRIRKYWNSSLGIKLDNVFYNTEITWKLIFPFFFLLDKKIWYFLILTYTQNSYTYAFAARFSLDVLDYLLFSAKSIVCLSFSYFLLRFDCGKSSNFYLLSRTFFMFVIFFFPFCVFHWYQPTIMGEIQSPMGVASVEFIDPREPVMVSLW